MLAGGFIAVGKVNVNSSIYKGHIARVSPTAARLHFKAIGKVSHQKVASMCMHVG
jgi:hypothetical protein